MTREGRDQLTFPHDSHRWTLRPFFALEMRPVLVYLVGSSDGLAERCMAAAVDEEASTLSRDEPSRWGLGALMLERRGPEMLDDDFRERRPSSDDCEARRRLGGWCWGGAAGEA